MAVRTIIMAVGTFVLQYRTAPSFSSISTSVALYSAGVLTRDVKPTVLSLPLMLKLSFSEMGRPWSGPTGWPVRWRWSSRDLACWIASSKNASLKQLVCVLINGLYRCRVACPPYQLLSCSSTLAEGFGDFFGAPDLGHDLLEDMRRATVSYLQLSWREPA